MKQKFNQMKQMAQQMTNMKSVAPNILPGVKPGDMLEVKCSNCGGEVFSPAHLLKFASRFQSTNAQPTLVQFPLGFMCVTCNQINPFDIEQLQNAKPSDKKEETLGISVNDGVTAKEKLS